MAVFQGCARCGTLSNDVTIFQRTARGTIQVTIVRPDIEGKT